MEQFYQIAADAVLLLHGLIVAFIVFGLMAILVGGVMRWQWIANPWFRVAHLVGIGIVVAQAWLGVLCPLTTLEMWLRRQARGETYQESFIEHWLQQVLFYDFPWWVFVVAYTLFGLLVAIAWIRFPPRYQR